jgi:hypothetical protein
VPILKLTSSGPKGSDENMHATRTTDQVSTPLVTVRFAAPIAGRDPIDGTQFTADRHRVAATSVRQDVSETVFISPAGEILCRWPTEKIVSVEWPAPDDDSDDSFGSETGDGHRVGSNEWLAAIKRKHPRAYAPWSRDEDTDLLARHDAGLSVAEIARLHERRPGAVTSRLNKLGIT